jgi:uncharacterized membrane protein
LAYELMINGESFSIEADRQERLQSKDSPSVTYDVALRIAMIQPVSLNTVRFEYVWPAQVEDDRGRTQRTARIRHELGYTMLVTDLGPGLAAGSEDEALKLLADSVAAGLRASGIAAIREDKPHTHQFPSAAGRGVVIRYRDAQDYDQVSLVYLLTGEKFAAGVVAQYFQRDAADVLPGIRKTIDSLRPLR